MIYYIRNPVICSIWVETRLLTTKTINNGCSFEPIGYKKKVRSNIIEDQKLTHAVPQNNIKYQFLQCNKSTIMLLKHLLKTVENIGLCSRVVIFLDSKCNNILGISLGL